MIATRFNVKFSLPKQSSSFMTPRRIGSFTSSRSASSFMSSKRRIGYFTSTQNSPFFQSSNASILIPKSASPLMTKNYFHTNQKEPNHQFHRNSTRYAYTPRSVLNDLDKMGAPPVLTLEANATASDKFAYYSVRALRQLSNVFYRQKYIHYACVLETVAAVPGMVAGMINHLMSLRRLETNNWIKLLLDEAENERMHLMTFMEIAKPSRIERLGVALVQLGYWNLFLALYMMSPKTAHKMVAYLEQEAVISYTNMIRDIDDGKVPNYPAPQIALTYWGLPDDATLRDVILVVRADEVDHRDVNGEMAKYLKEGRNATHSITIHDK